MDDLKPMIAGNEAGFRVLFECATIGILVISKNGSIELLNSCAESIFGYPKEELIGKSVEVLIPKNLRQKHIHHRESYFDYPKARPMGLGRDLYACKKDGVVFPVEISLGHYELDGENMAVAFITDISERKRAETELIESKHKLDEEAVALKYLSEAGGRLWHIGDLGQGIEEILASSIELMGVDQGNVQLWDEEKKVLRIVAHKGLDQDFLDHFKEVSAEDDSACGQALKERKQVVVEDTEKEWSGVSAVIARNNGFRAVQSTPLFARDGSTMGMISTHFKTQGVSRRTAFEKNGVICGQSTKFYRTHKEL